LATWYDMGDRAMHARSLGVLPVSKAWLLCAVVAAVLGPAVGASAQFIPGRVYTVKPAFDTCMSTQYPHERIWEMDPVSGHARVFAEIPPALCGGITSLAFTPDGSRLRAELSNHHDILQ